MIDDLDRSEKTGDEDSVSFNEIINSNSIQQWTVYVIEAPITPLEGVYALGEQEGAAPAPVQTTKLI